MKKPLSDKAVAEVACACLCMRVCLCSNMHLLSVAQMKAQAAKKQEQEKLNDALVSAFKKVVSACVCRCVVSVYVSVRAALCCLRFAAHTTRRAQLGDERSKIKRTEVESVGDGRGGGSVVL
jgi:hypothetical protein